MSAKERATNGLKLLLGTSESFSQVQAAWRFLNNPNVSTQALFKPIFETLESEVSKQCNEYVLAMSDWSHLDYKKHSSKKELTHENRKETCMKIGYDLQTTLAVSDKTGEPIAPIVHNLKSSKKVYSTYSDTVIHKQTHLKELALRAKWIDKNLKSDKRVVHIVDREADSVAFMRELSSNGNLFLLRVKDNSKLYYPEEDIDINQKNLAQKLPLGIKVKEIKYRNKKTSIYVNECDVEVRRDATTMILSGEGKRKLQKTKGDTLKARFIVERLVDENNKVVAKWLLITNIIDKKVTTETLATWYYYRWKIESYFKLLKSSGFNLEEWQQIEPEALFKRLLVVSYSCILVWKIANGSSENAQKIRKFLVTMSGKLIERNKEFTYPALLSGLENYIQMMDMMLLFSQEELLDMKKELIEIMGINI
jgi:hypothetical protein